MAHIVSFAVTGLVGRRGVYTQRLNRDVNVFFGLNGTGKTSLLKILHSAMANEAAGLENVPFGNAEVTIYSVKLGAEVKRVISRVDVKPDSHEQTMLDESVFTPEPQRAPRRPPSELRWSTIPADPEAAASWAHRYLPTARVYLNSDPSATHYWRDRELEYADPGELPQKRMARAEQLIERSFAVLLQDSWRRYATELNSRVRQAQAEGLTNILRAVLATGNADGSAPSVDPEVALRRVQAFLKRQGASNVLRSSKSFIARLEEDPRLRSVVRDINDVELGIEAATAPRDRLETLITGLFSGNKRVEFSDDGTISVKGRTEGRIPLAALSSGEKQIIRIFIDALLAENNSLIIDEPELSMHIDWQRRLLLAMRDLNPGAQLIVATHSPEIMAEIPDANIFAL